MLARQGEGWSYVYAGWCQRRLGLAERGQRRRKLFAIAAATAIPNPCPVLSTGTVAGLEDSVEAKGVAATLPDDALKIVARGGGQGRSGRCMNKFVTERPYADSEAAARKLVEIANSVEAVQDGRIFIELINWPFLHDLKGTPEEYAAGLKPAIERDWLKMHESGTYVKFPPAGAELFA
jgi:hypothetical protein